MKLMIATALTLLVAATAAAAAEKVVVPANKTSVLGQLFFYDNQTCGNPGKPKVTLSKKPAHGRVDTRWEPGKMNKADHKRCIGKPLYGLTVIYTPDKGYHGKDFFRIGLRSVIYGGSHDQYHSWDIDLDIR